MKRSLLRDQSGTAMFVAIMMLALSTGLGLLAFHVSTTELKIANHEEDVLSPTYLAESGIEKVLSWIAHPDRSPDPLFFGSLSSPTAHCSGRRGSPDFKVSASLLQDTIGGPFSELNGMGKVVDISLYEPSNKVKGICAIESQAQAPSTAAKSVRVEITRSPLEPITAGIQGAGTNISPVWTHWGIVRYAGSAALGPVNNIPAKDPSVPPNIRSYIEDGNRKDAWLEIHVAEDILDAYPKSPIKGLPYDQRTNVFENDPSVTLDQWNSNEVRNFAKKYGSYYVISSTGKLEQGTVVKGSFDEIFDKPGKDFGLVYIDRTQNSAKELIIKGGNYKGYFYIAGDVQVLGDHPGQTVNAQPPPKTAGDLQSMTLSNINLDGLLYVSGHLTLQQRFSIYGAAYSGEGFAGPGASSLEVWYNSDFKRAIYAGVPSIVRLKGTWRYFANPS